ncbi:GspH/FimT family pseudopilin [Oceanisphaera sp. IT1-181]|uniref:GspH/FimT family pseudopilin n=1 Tax=Oceanisphaera sp. IT1-181 TaxID=3081199 RepID=UPI0029CA65B3|nr:GspH/FimT family pseudopilin [Oceanisphaera sp. IT1-181]
MTRGFTLLELVVVMVIAMLALSIVAPKFAALLPGVTLKTYSQQTASLLRMARSEAIAQAQATELVFDGQARQTRILGAEQTYAWPKNIQLLFTAQNGIQANSPQPRLIFYPDGSASGGLVTLSSSSGQYRIEVNWLTGSVRTLE